MSLTVAPTSGLDRYFKISERGSSVRTEIIAGLATWLTMAYILFVFGSACLLMGCGTDSRANARRRSCAELCPSHTPAGLATLT
jgi:hypothetical protein